MSRHCKYCNEKISFIVAIISPTNVCGNCCDALNQINDIKIDEKERKKRKFKQIDIKRRIKLIQDKVE